MHFCHSFAVKKFQQILISIVVTLEVNDLALQNSTRAGGRAGALKVEWYKNVYNI